MKKENVVIVVLSVLVISLGIFAFVLFRKGNMENSKTIYLDVETELVQDLYKMVNFSNDAVVLNHLYSDKGIPDAYKIGMGINQYLKNKEPIPVTNSLDLLSYIPANLVDANIKYVLGDISYQKQDAQLMISDYCVFFYNKELDRYEYKGGCGGSVFEFYYRKIDSAYKVNDRLYIKEKMFYLYDDWDDYISKKTVYSNPDRNNVLDYLETDSTGDYVIDKEKYIDKGSTYLYEFKKVDNNNHYIFLGIKRVK